MALEVWMVPAEVWYHQRFDGMQDDDFVAVTHDDELNTAGTFIVFSANQKSLGSWEALCKLMQMQHEKWSDEYLAPMDHAL